MENKIAKTKKRRIKGEVVSDKMEKTVVVAVPRMTRHPLYHKIMRMTTRYKAHDEYNRFKVGDKVIIEESRPISKDKRWVVKELAK